MGSQTEQALNSLIEAIRSELRSEFLDALGGGNGTIRKPKGRPPGARSYTRAATSTRAPYARPAPPSKGGKRSPEELERTTRDLLAAIRKKPGQRIEQLAETLGLPTKALALPAIKLDQQKMIATKGQRRGTQYFIKQAKATKPKQAKAQAKPKQAKPKQAKAAQPAAATA